MLYVIMVAIYLVIGFGAMWLVDRMNKKNMDKLFTEFENTDYRGVLRYVERQHRTKIVGCFYNKVNLLKVLIIMITAVTVWALWPVTTILAAIGNYINYVKTFNEGKKVTD